MIQTATTVELPQSLDEFRDWEPVDNYKYEWHDGEVIISEKMKKKHLPILRALQQLFFKTSAVKDGGALIMEQDVMLTGIQLRRPDLAYFSGTQIDNSTTSDEEPIPAFAIEIISPTDDAEKVEEKLAEYFKASVEVVWHIFPENKVVYVYTSRKDVKVCTDEDICSASPVLPDFEISVTALLGA